MAMSDFVVKAKKIGLGEASSFKGALRATMENKFRKAFSLDENEEILAVIRTGVTGLTSVGIVITPNKIYWKNGTISKVEQIDIDELKECVFEIDDESVRFEIAELYTIKTGTIKPKKIAKLLAIVRRTLGSGVVQYVETGSAIDIPARIANQYFIPKSKHSLLFKLQKHGFLLRNKFQFFRDITIYMIIFCSFFYFAMQGKELLLYTTISAVALSAIYILIYVMTSGLIYYWLGGLFLAAILSAIFPPGGIIAALLGFLFLIRKVLAILKLLPWVIFGAIMYIVVLYVAPVENPIHSNNFVILSSIVFLVAVFTSSKYNLASGIFHFAIMFGVAPVIVILLLAHDSDTQHDDYYLEFEVGDITYIIDDLDIKIMFPDGSYLHYIELPTDGIPTPQWQYFA